MNDTNKSTSAAILDGLEVSHAVLTAQSMSMSRRVVTDRVWRLCW